MITGVHIINEGIYNKFGEKSSNRFSLISFSHHFKVKNKKRRYPI